jgi:ribose-phosphate pyrophosphokinase
VTPLCLALPGNEALATAIVTAIGAEPGRLVVRRFPDGESYVRIESAVAGRDVVLACTLDRPDAKLIPLVLVAATAKDLGAMRVGLVAPYLGYLRQDARFRDGEGVTSAYVARVLSASVDWLVTVDPHLHRRRSLAEIYSIPTAALRAAPLVADWIRAHVRDPLVIGPDVESTQWVGEVARDAGAPDVVLEKTRRGDRDVEVSVPDVEWWPGRTPVLVDDIVSTGRTMIAAIAALRGRGMAAPVVVGVHAVFADDAWGELAAARPAAVVTADTIPHPSHAIAVGDVVAAGVRAMLRAHG